MVMIQIMVFYRMVLALMPNIARSKQHKEAQQ
jgi:hypothetical protein